jgi:hypothetical protein
MDAILFYFIFIYNNYKIFEGVEASTKIKKKIKILKGR